MFLSSAAWKEAVSMVDTMSDVRETYGILFEQVDCTIDLLRQVQGIASIAGSLPRACALPYLLLNPYYPLGNTVLLVE